MPTDRPRPDGDVSIPSSSALKETSLPDGSVQLQVPWPLDVEELKGLLGPMLAKYRIIHFMNATKVGGKALISTDNVHDDGESFGVLVTTICLSGGLISFCRNVDPRPRLPRPRSPQGV